MVRLNEVTLNQFFETLSDWEQLLQAENIDIDALEADEADDKEEIAT